MPKTLKYGLNNDIILWGRPDDYLEIDNGCIVGLDHKTKSKEPVTVHSAYQLQLDVYSYLLKAMGFKTTDKAYLAFYYPDECELHNGMPFNCITFVSFLLVERAHRTHCHKRQTHAKVQHSIVHRTV